MSNEPYGNKWKRYQVWPKLTKPDGGGTDYIKLNIGSSDGTPGTQGVQGSTGPSGSTGNGNIPDGGIILWSGAVIDIPIGWELCDGTFGTPDLTDRFIVGAGVSYAVGDQGGSPDSVLVEHTHTVTDPGHNHGMIRKWSTGQTEPSNLGSGNDGGNMSSSGDTDQATTGISNSTEGVDGTNTNLPPYYALAYIMKLATN